MFLEDAQIAIDFHCCAAAVLKTLHFDTTVIPDGQVRIAFDGVFSDESERIYKTQGMDAFHAQENARRDEPMAEGPYASNAEIAERGVS